LDEAKETGPLRVLYRTPRLVLVDKPAGLLSVPGKGPDKQDCVATRVAAMFPSASGPLVCHRLDMETSGVMVLALDAEAHRGLSRQFEDRSVEKEYEAIVHGAPPGDAGVVELKQRLDVQNRPLQVVDEAQGRAAVTRWRVRERGKGATAALPPAGDRTTPSAEFSRVLFEPVTGRSHQIRLAAATPAPVGLGCPIVGDSLYGRAGDRAARLMLHATRLALTEPSSGERLVIERPAPF